MSFFRHYSVIIGLALLAVMAVVLAASPDMIFSTGVSLVDTDLAQSTGTRNYIKTSMNFGDAKRLQEFPTQLDGWNGFDRETSETEYLRDYLKTDAILWRVYTQGTRGVDFVILQSKNRSSFHSPTDCYPAQGWQIEEEGKAEIPTSLIRWPEDMDAQTALGDSFPVKKLVLRSGEGDAVQRLLVLYFYIMQNPLNFFTPDSITMIRVSDQIPSEGSYDSNLATLKEFTALAIPQMFEPAKDYKGGQSIAAMLAGYGIPGNIAIALMLAVPLSIILSPVFRRFKRTPKTKAPPRIIKPPQRKGYPLR